MKQRSDYGPGERLNKGEQLMGGGVWGGPDTARGRVWAACRVHTGREVEITQRLSDMGHEVYCPTFLKTVRKRPWRLRETVEVIRGAFAGYMFLDVRSVTDLEKIYREPDFHYFVRFGDKWALLNDEAIIGIRELETDGALLPRLRAATTDLEVGDDIKVCYGPFGGLKGKVVAVLRNRVWVKGGDFTIPVEFQGLHLRVESV